MLHHERLLKLLAQDPNNLLLLADTADAAIAAGVFQRADEVVETGLRLSTGDAAWKFRQATLRIAQRRLDDACIALNSMGEAHASHPAVVHNLAYIEFLRGDYAGAVEVLRPALGNATTMNAAGEDPAAQALWLRALHRMGDFEGAWAWAQERLRAGRLGPIAAGVASLIALDRSNLEAAERLAQQALDAGVRDPEALVARASAAIADIDTKLAKTLFEEALQRSPDDARAWSGLGLAATLDQNFAQARIAFENALKTQPQAEYLQGLGWACVMTQDLPAAAIALDRAIAMDDTNAESHGARAVVYALQKDAARARIYAERAQALNASSETARLALAIIDGNASGPFSPPVAR